MKNHFGFRPGSLLVIEAGAYLWNLDGNKSQFFPRRDYLVLKVSDEPLALRSPEYPNYSVILVPHEGGKLFICQEAYLSEVLR